MDVFSGLREHVVGEVGIPAHLEVSVAVVVELVEVVGVVDVEEETALPLELETAFTKEGVAFPVAAGVQRAGGVELLA